MIAKGASRSGARQLAVYLMRVERWDTGEPAELLELRSPWATGVNADDRHRTAEQLIEAFRDWQTLVDLGIGPSAPPDLLQPGPSPGGAPARLVDPGRPRRDRSSSTGRHHPPRSHLPGKDLARPDVDLGGDRGEIRAGEPDLLDLGDLRRLRRVVLQVGP